MTDWLTSVENETNVDWKERCKKIQRNCNKHVTEERRAWAACAKAEHANRDLVIDRNHWKERAMKAEAALASLGSDA